MNDSADSTEAYDLRQYNLMLKMIDLYKGGSITLGHLVANLEALREALRAPAESALTGFDSLWGKLEDTHAVMLDEGRKEFSDFDRQLIETSLAEFESLIRRALTL